MRWSGAELVADHRTYQGTANLIAPGTRRFCLAAGFVPLRELGLRSWNNGYALMLARAI